MPQILSQLPNSDNHILCILCFRSFYERHGYERCFPFTLFDDIWCWTCNYGLFYTKEYLECIIFFVGTVLRVGSCLKLWLTMGQWLDEEDEHHWWWLEIAMPNELLSVITVVPWHMENSLIIFIQSQACMILDCFASTDDPSTIVLYTCMYHNLSISSKSASWQLSVKSKDHEHNSQHGHMFGFIWHLTVLLTRAWTKEHTSS